MADLDLPGDAEPSTPGEPKPIQTRSAHTRNRKTYDDKAEGTERRSDWSRFEIGSVLRTLKLAEDKATLQRELRKLHLRWWHAPKNSMTKVLEAAGLPKRVLEMVPDIVDTCRECRKWTRPQQITQASLRMSTKFNEHVEMDLMFYKQYTICHFIDRASRWHLAVGVPGKTDKDLWEALATTWLTHHGPMTELITDGESGVVESTTFQNELKARGIKLQVRAPQQHARYIERRGALLRHGMHVIESQLKREGVAVSFATLLSEAVFAGKLSYLCWRCYSLPGRIR